MTRLLYLFVLFGLIACNDAPKDNAEAEAVAGAATEVRELSWDQLMPSGEEERLAELYSSFYESLNEQMAVTLDSSGSAAEGDTQELVSSIAEGSANDTMEQIGTFNVVNELNGQTVRLPGYVVPFDFNAEAAYREFLLVPYFGACLHTPPPPPNQIVFVKADTAVNITDIYEPIWVEGVLKTGEFNSDLANTAYELALNKVEVYEY